MYQHQGCVAKAVQGFDCFNVTLFEFICKRAPLFFSLTLWFQDALLDQTFDVHLKKLPLRNIDDTENQQKLDSCVKF
jgi:hypothetical protein